MVKILFLISDKMCLEQWKKPNNDYHKSCDAIMKLNFTKRD